MWQSGIINSNVKNKYQYAKAVAQKAVNDADLRKRINYSGKVDINSIYKHLYNNKDLDNNYNTWVNNGGQFKYNKNSNRSLDDQIFDFYDSNHITGLGTNSHKSFYSKASPTERSLYKELHNKLVNRVNNETLQRKQAIADQKAKEDQARQKLIDSKKIPNNAQITVQSNNITKAPLTGQALTNRLNQKATANGFTDSNDVEQWQKWMNQNYNSGLSEDSDFGNASRNVFNGMTDEQRNAWQQFKNNGYKNSTDTTPIQVDNTTTLVNRPTGKFLPNLDSTPKYDYNISPERIMGYNRGSQFMSGWDNYLSK